MNAFHYPPVNAAALRGGCYLTSIGSLSYRKSQDYPVKGHPAEFAFDWRRGRVLSEFALVLIVDGAGEWQTRQEEPVRIEAGDGFLLVPGQWHRYRPLKFIGWMEKWICLRGTAVHGFVRAGTLPEFCTVLPKALNPEMEGRFDRLQRDVLADPLRNLPSWGARALAIFLESCGDPAIPEHPVPQLAPPVEMAVRFIENNCHRPLNVARISHLCGVERRTLERRFKSAGLGPIGKFIIQQRIARAEILLSETTLTVKEIAYTCGFGAAQRMIYDFQEYRGTTPGQWREKN